MGIYKIEYIIQISVGHDRTKNKINIQQWKWKGRPS